jgi:hypothetical protein
VQHTTVLTDGVPPHKSVPPPWRGLQVLESLCPRAAQVAAGCLFSLGPIDGSAVPRAQEPGQRPGITAVGLHAIPGLLGNQRGCHAPTGVAFLVAIALEPGATGAGCIDEDEAWRLRWALTSEWIDSRVSCADGPAGDDGGVVLWGDRGHGAGVLVDIQTDRQCARLGYGCPPSVCSSCCAMMRLWLFGKLTRDALGVSRSIGSHYV